MPRPNTARLLRRAASSAWRITPSSSSATRSSALPTMAGAGRRLIEAPVVVPNRSAISLARVGSGERDVAPLSWTISVAFVQPGRRTRASSSIVRPHETPIVPVGRSSARSSAAAPATASRASSWVACSEADIGDVDDDRVAQPEAVLE